MTVMLGLLWEYIFRSYCQSIENRQNILKIYLIETIIQSTVLIETIIQSEVLINYHTDELENIDSLGIERKLCSLSSSKKIQKLAHNFKTLINYRVALK